MRRREFAEDRNWALDLLQGSTVLHLAGTTPEGLPVLRTVNPIFLGDHVYFHCSPKGEKVLCVGRPAVLQCEKDVVTTPSYFVHAKDACPATTYFQSVQVHGTLQAVHEPGRKAAILSALMKQYQPEGGYDPITTDNPRYRAALKGLLIVGMSLDTVTGKNKLGQNRTPSQLASVLKGLWQRGNVRDLPALELILRQNRRAQVPNFLRGPEGLRFCVAPTRDDATAVAKLLKGEYWTQGTSACALASAHSASPVWIVARAQDGSVVASARAISDTARHAHIADVIVEPSRRGRGLGRALLGVLFDHPALRHTTHVSLSTVDSVPFYEGLGFVRVAQRGDINDLLLVRAFASLAKSQTS